MSASPLTDYQPPKILTSVATFLNILRESHSKNFAQFVVVDGYARESYQKGLVGLACILAGVVFVWGCLLVMLKCKGKDAGCAAGFTFDSGELSKRDDEAGSTDESSRTPSTRLPEPSSPQKSVGSQANNDDGSSIASAEMNGSYIESNSVTSLEEYSVDFQQPYASKREQRSIRAFFFFSLATFACVPMILIFFFKPINSAAAASGIYITDARAVVSEVKAALSTIASATNSSMLILQNAPSDINTICPQLQANFSDALQVDLEEMLQIIHTSYSSMEQDISGNLTQVEEVLSGVSGGIDGMEYMYESTEDYSFLVPVVLLVLSTITAIATIGVGVARKGESNKRFQCILTYSILPMLVVFSLICWAAAIATAVASVVSSDACTQSSKHGSPQSTIMAVLQARNMTANSTIYKFVSAYTGDCADGGPSASLTILESDVQEIIDYIWRYLSSVDSVGRESLVQLCGSSKLEDFLNAARDLAKLLTTIRNAIDSATVSLECSRIHLIYVKAVQESLCTEVSAASAWGFLLFIAIGVTSMGMVTLRASWRQRIAAEKCYSEDDEAEMMVMDEHEEYLVYISRYKHEWQEYGGLEGALPAQCPTPENDDALADVVSQSEMVVTDEKGQEYVLALQHIHQTQVSTVQEPFDPYANSASERSQSPCTIASSEISFLSLGQGSTSNDDELGFHQPPSLLDNQHDDESIQEAVFPPAGPRRQPRVSSLQLHSVFDSKSRLHRDYYSERFGSINKE